jgi:ribosome-associated protein
VQVQAIAKSIHERVEKEGLSPKKMEGYNEARWVLIDLDDIVVHVFHKEEREFYNLEKLWADATQVQANEG